MPVTGLRYKKLTWIAKGVNPTRLYPSITSASPWDSFLNRWLKGPLPIDAMRYVKSCTWV
jgi:hypothetical protein